MESSPPLSLPLVSFLCFVFVLFSHFRSFVAWTFFIRAVTCLSCRNLKIHVHKPALTPALLHFLLSPSLLAYALLRHLFLSLPKCMIISFSLLSLTFTASLFSLFLFISQICVLYFVVLFMFFISWLQAVAISLKRPVAFLVWLLFFLEILEILYDVIRLALSNRPRNNYVLEIQAYCAFLSRFSRFSLALISFIFILKDGGYIAAGTFEPFFGKILN